MCALFVSSRVVKNKYSERFQKDLCVGIQSNVSGVIINSSSLRRERGVEYRAYNRGHLLALFHVHAYVVFRWHLSTHFASIKSIGSESVTICTNVNSQFSALRSVLSTLITFINQKMVRIFHNADRPEWQICHLPVSYNILYFSRYLFGANHIWPFQFHTHMT